MYLWFFGYLGYGLHVHSLVLAKSISEKQECSNPFRYAMFCFVLFFFQFISWFFILDSSVCTPVSYCGSLDWGHAFSWVIPSIMLSWLFLSTFLVNDGVWCWCFPEQGFSFCSTVSRCWLLCALWSQSTTVSCPFMSHCYSGNFVFLCSLGLYAVFPVISLLWFLSITQDDLGS